ncbi:hypothetical protein [Psychroflexus sp. ALD_RP9]|uniref:hypothetical protein n=1 Tax=Psychroflexus sp. ALD_RP9 TaxID=2777186 RepID=UPI001A8CAE8E|nr:hypothetical protein [Psychroflexus sp. ALD_RP9]QSS97957.1 hypothetical protein IMZ30_04390 [Psychroflexus sp. ALD_RP9]
MTKYFIAFALVICCWSCSQTQEKTASKNTDFYALKLSVDTISIAQLSNKAEEFANEWDDYLAIKTEIARTKAMNIGDALNNAENIIRISDSLKASLPDTFNIEPIKARLKLMETQARNQQQLLARKSQDTLAIKESIYKLIQSFSSLNTQINECFIETPQFIEPKN